MIKDLANNNLIRFTKISKKKNGLFAIFSAKGIRGGMSFAASITVDFSEAEVDPGDSLEKIIESCGKIATRKFKAAELEFEGLAAL